MAAFFSLTQRFSAANKQEDAIDPWNLGVSTSTSTAETVGPQSDDNRIAKNPPSTPEGLRPRKSIQRIRRDVLGSNYNDSRLSYNLPPEANSCARESSTSSRPVFENDLGILPSSLQRIEGSPIRSASSFYEQSIAESNKYFDEDLDINSSMETESMYSRIQAESPDLQRGSRPKTAVGAVLVAMAETSEQRTNKSRQSILPPRSTGYHGSILPPRSWMDNKNMGDRYSTNDIVRTDSNPEVNYGCDDDNQSSLHASPSSLRRGVFSNVWNEEQHFQNDSSFTRRILNDDPSSSRIEERSIVDHSPYDFNPIIEDDIHSDLRRGRVAAPRLLSLTNDDDKLNISAISNSNHPRDFESLADTIEDEEEEYKEIPTYYQALGDDAPTDTIISDDAFLMKKVENQRMDKEDLLRSVFERFQDCLDILKDVYSPTAIENSFFLGLGKTKIGAEYFMHMQTLLSELQEGGKYGAQRQALSFFLSVLKNSTSPTYLPNTRWVPRSGFRGSIGLHEEPQSPQTIRGGDTSLFSLPSESANADTPHTSNVSLTSTITTVVSPNRYASSIHNRQQSYFASGYQNGNSTQGTRKTMNSLARLLYRLEETCRGLKSKIRGKSLLVESIQKIYFEFLNVSSSDLRSIVSSFDMEYCEPQKLARAVSTDEDIITATRSPAPSRSNRNELEISQEQVTAPYDALRVNIVESDHDDIDSDKRNESIECDLWSPTTNDMISLVSPQSQEGNATNNGYAALREEEPIDDLRRTVGSFDEREAEDEREGPVEDEREPNQETFPATFTRRVVGRRPRKSRFWKKRFLALKNRGRQVTAE